MKPHPQTLIRSVAGGELLSVSQIGSVNVSYGNQARFYSGTIDDAGTYYGFMLRNPLGSDKVVTVWSIRLTIFRDNPNNSIVWRIRKGSTSSVTGSIVGVPFDSLDPPSIVYLDQSINASSVPTPLWSGYLRVLDRGGVELQSEFVFDFSKLFGKPIILPNNTLASNYLAIQPGSNLTSAWYRFSAIWSEE